MHDKGRSIEQIAKAMGINKGEVQLILQLVRREEQQHA
jgi:DNA-directed RNA polymerase specialized sigma24 family protein